MEKSYIGKIVEFYVKYPTQAFFSFALTMLFMCGIIWMFPDWSAAEYFILGTAFFTVILLIVSNSVDWWSETKLEQEYNDVMENPFEYHFLIPPDEKFKINYHKQTNESQLLKELKLPKKSEHIIILKLTPKIDLDVRAAEFGFSGDKNVKPTIICYDNPFVVESSEDIKPKWYRDWHDRYHLIIENFWEAKEVRIIGFRIKTNKSGKYEFNYIINVKSSKYKTMEKTKVSLVKHNLIVNVE